MSRYADSHPDNREGTEHKRGYKVNTRDRFPACCDREVDKKSNIEMQRRYTASASKLAALVDRRWRVGK